MGWKQMPDHARAALAHLSQKFSGQLRTGEVDLAWARRIVERHQRGEPVAAMSLRMACEALQIPAPQKETSHGVE